MMTTPVSDTGVESYRAAQAAVTRGAVADMRKLRRLIIPTRLRASIPDWITAVRALIGHYGNASASLAADFYDAQRVAARVTGSFTVPLAPPPPDGQVDNSLRWATKDVWPRDPEDSRTTPAQLEPLETRLDVAQKKSEAVTQKLVLDQGRGTIQGAVKRDRQATGWARAASLGACAFCRLLATRGTVYKEDTAGFKAHDGCHCQPLPVYRGQKFELSSHAQEWKRLYDQYAAPYSGDQLARFRRAIAEHDAAH